MPAGKKPEISARKLPRQSRSTHLVEAILEAAIRVLSREGAQRFTTARVAEAAGVSVGSLYQYFPNKEAILYRLQTDEWRRTSEQMDAILSDQTRAPLERIRVLVHAFFLSEWEEAALRIALGDAAPSYREAPEVREHRRAGMKRAVRFMGELLPQVPVKQRRLAAELTKTTMSTLGKKVSEQARSRAEVAAWAAATGQMLCAYLSGLQRRD